MIKKIILGVLICFVSLFAFIGCLSNETEGTGDSQSLKLTDTKKCEDCSIKMSTKHNSSATYYITPENFDYDKLEEKEYKMKVSVSYDVYYKKDYDVLWDIGYAGSPKYEVYILNDDLIGVKDENLTTKTTTQSRSIVYTSSIVDLRNMKLTLTFSTNNIQNIIYFKNINVNYKCIK